MSVKISRTNSKLGIIPSVNLPPITTCRPSCPCAADCYATKGRFRFVNVKSNMTKNYVEYKENPDQYFKAICGAINNGIISYSYFRWHASGDIVDEAYFDGMISVATQCPSTSFLAFTKKFEIVNQYIANHGSLPSNLNVVLSAWGNSFKVENPYNLPVAYVRFNNQSEDVSIPLHAEECGGNCQDCLKCWNIKSGQAVVFNKH